MKAAVVEAFDRPPHYRDFGARLRLAEIANGVDVVLDYLWGPSAEAFFAAATGGGSSEAARSIRFANIGSLGGATIALSASALRNSGVEIVGSGLGSLSIEALVRSVAHLISAHIHTGEWQHCLKIR